MDVVSAKVVGSIALAFGVAFVAIVIGHLTRPEIDVLQVLLYSALAVLWLGIGAWLWRFGLRKSKGDR